ncbi:MCE family protein [Nocardioides panacisoli]|uniref:MCE family protein n=1 Tax=Nocardioides panacisoli TaxID=627624 RepID=UPI001C6317B0|nr:MCE family protein [Nocardioides panacisoli]QYJ03848.1 MCE family protein [Nocardioides panacisoli]
MKPFRERNPVVIGAISISVLAMLLLAAFRAGDLPLIGGGDTYYANFTEAGGLSVGDPVRLAGVRVGEVDTIELASGEVKVGFKVDTDAQLGDRPEADIRVQTILGQMFVALVPAGEGEFAEGETIPSERTRSPYNVIDAFEGLAETSEGIDTDQLTEALTTLSDLTRNTPDEFRDALNGLSALSETVVKRDAELNSLLQNTQRVSRVLDERDEDIIALMDDARVLFEALVSRRDAVHDLLVSATTLSRELKTFVRESRADLRPALQRLESVVDVLNKNQDNLDNSLRLAAPFARVFANTLGTGPWFDTFVSNLPPVPGGRSQE